MSAAIKDLTDLKAKMQRDPVHYSDSDVAAVDRAVSTIFELRELVARGRKSKAGLGTQNVKGALSDTEDTILSILRNRPGMWQDIYQIREIVNARGLTRNYQQVQRETSKLLGRGLIEAELRGVKLVYRWVPK
jgi:hypothetical protein